MYTEEYLLNAKDIIEKADAKGILALAVPNIFNVIGNTYFNWDVVTMKFKEIYHDRVDRYRSEKVEVLYGLSKNIFDVLIDWHKGEDSNVALVEFYQETLFKSLGKLLDEREKELIKEIVFKMLLCYNIEYLNFVGELAVLMKFKEAGYTFLDYEVLINDDKPMGRSIDFLIEKDSKKFCLEIECCHLVETETIKENINKIRRKVSRKINRKIRICTDESKTILLVPILWGSHKLMTDVYKDMEEHKLNFYNTFPFSSYGRYNYKGKNYFKFGRIKDLIVDKDFVL